MVNTFSKLPIDCGATTRSGMIPDGIARRGLTSIALPFSHC